MKGFDSTGLEDSPISPHNSLQFNQYLLHSPLTLEILFISTNSETILHTILFLSI